MGIFSSPKQTNPYAPPLPQDGAPLRFTMLGGGGQNSALGGATALVRVADDPPRQISPPTQGSDNSSKVSNYYLKFDGRYLRLHDGDNVVKEWPGVSGKENFGSGRDQEKRNFGPIPEGTYDIKQSRYEKMDELRQRLGGLLRWPGGTRSWGTERVWADPSPETVASGLTFGRKDMAIHGGDIPGSAGCIDLTHNMPDFANTFRSLGRDLKLYGDYNPPSPP